MKRIVLLFALAAVVVTVSDLPIRFKTDFHCRQHEERWCAAAYFFELDSSSSDDAILHFRFCTSNHTKTVSIEIKPLEGDGGAAGVFQSFYEIGYKVFHTCAPVRSCSHHHDIQYVKYNWEHVQTVHNTIIWPDRSFDLGSTDCTFPEAFIEQNIRGYSNPPPISPFDALNEIDDEERIYWWQSDENRIYEKDEHD